MAVEYTRVYRMAGNFRGIQFSRKAHLQRFRDLIFADGRSRVAPPTISVWLHLLLHARHGSNLVGTGRKKQQAIDRSYLYLAEIEKWHESSIWSRLEIFVQKKLNNNELVWSKPAVRSMDQSSWAAACTTMATPPVIARVRVCLVFLFRGFNFRGSPVNRENYENWLPGKFPAIR